MSDNNRYQKGKIYRIICNTTGLQYYGSTCEDKLCKRLAHHKSDYNGFINGKQHNFMTSFNIIKNDNYEIVLVENYPCNSKDELHQRERYYIENNECVNKFIPCRTSKEYREENKEQIREKKKIYREENKDQISEKKKIYREANIEKIKEKNKIYCEANKDKKKIYDKIYREAKKEKINEKRRKSYEINKDIINENRRKKIEESKLKKLMII